MKIHQLLALIPFIGLLGGVPFANKVTPYVFGMPFVLFYIVLWVVLTSGIMAIVFKLDPSNKEEEI
jgi:pilus assembly protein TadC